ncbi:MAG: hypothetical protein QXI16_04615 [Sulfolobaceae archaeon]
MGNKKYVAAAIVIWILLNLFYILVSKFSILSFIGFNALVGAVITIPFILLAQIRAIQKVSLVIVSLGYSLVGFALIIMDSLKCCNELWNILTIAGVLNILIGKGVFFTSFVKCKEVK